jgi:hypothetical protein
MRLLLQLRRVFFGWMRCYGCAPLEHDPELISAQKKQDELFSRLRTLVDRVQVISGRTDILWKEYERRSHSQSLPFPGEQRRFSDRFSPPQTH